MDRRLAAIAAVQSRIGHQFADPLLLERALTHASVGQGSKLIANNETLEFLGDRVLGLLAAQTLLETHPDWREGDLNRRHVVLVNGHACAEVARGIGLGEALRLDGSASAQGGRDNDRILGDAMEALIAAVYLDGGLEAARQVIVPMLGGGTGGRAPAAIDRDAKTRLQEVAQGRGWPLPEYRLIAETGPDHSKHFQVECFLPDPNVVVEQDPRDAEEWRQNHARHLLDALLGDYEVDG